MKIFKHTSDKIILSEINPNTVLRKGELGLNDNMLIIGDGTSSAEELAQAGETPTESITTFECSVAGATGSYIVSVGATVFNQIYYDLAMGTKCKFINKNNPAKEPRTGVYTLVASEVVDGSSTIILETEGELIIDSTDTRIEQQVLTISSPTYSGQETLRTIYIANDHIV